MNLKEIGWEGVDCIQLTWGQKQVSGCFELCIEPLGTEKEGDFMTS